MNKSLLRGRVFAALGAGIKSMIMPQAWAGLAFSGLFLLAFVTPAGAQQTVTVLCNPVRVTAPLNFSGTKTVGVNLGIAGGSGEVDLSLSGLPTGATAAFNTTSFTASGATTLTLDLTNVAEGTYILEIDATNSATNTFLLPLQIADVWSGGGATMNLSDTGNWNGGTAPGANDDVVFGSTGAITNTTTNVIVNISATIASMRFAQTNSTNVNFNVLINPGVTLAITGTNGFSIMRDVLNLAWPANVTFSGQSGSLLVSNETANIATFIDNSSTNALDLSKLGYFKADVSQIGIGDYLLFPNVLNLFQNGNGNRPNKFLPTTRLAATNIIKAVYVDPNNYTNASTRAYAFTFVDNPTNSTGSTLPQLFSLGVSNVFMMDGFMLCGFGAGGVSLNFNTNFQGSNPSAYFRNTDGVSRMSMFCIADGAGSLQGGVNTKANNFNGVDFSVNGGSINALVDRFIMCRDHPVSVGSGCTAQGRMVISKGIFDCNTAILGDQDQGSQTEVNYCQGQLIVSNTAVFRVNNDMELGYTTTASGDASLPEDTSGQLSIGPGGTVEAYQIGVGGTTKASGENGGNGGGDIHASLNQITMTKNSLLIVSNNIADATPNGALGLFSFGGNSTLELFVNGTNSNPYVYVNSLTTSGTANNIQIGAINNLTPPAQVKLIQYAAGSPTFGVTVPAGYIATIVNNGPGSTIDAFIVAGTPKTIVWRGSQTANWNLTDKNWLDLNTGLQTNFANLDNVIFDDTAAIPTTIALQGQVIPGSITMTNSNNNYTFNGSGSTSGSATLTKTGTGSLDIEPSTTLSVVLQQGSLTGGGSLNALTVSPGATARFTGTISAGVVCGGTATTSGNVTGLIDVQNGGIYTNLNNVTGPITLESGSFMNNAGTLAGTSGTVATNAILVNNGFINDNGVSGGGTVTVNGTFQDNSDGNITLFRLTFSATGVFIPGAGGTGTTTILSDTIGAVPGRLSLNAGTMTMLAVNGANYTKVQSGALDYGGSQSAQSQNGCTLVITNLGAPFTAGQVFQFFQNSFNSGPPIPTGTSTNSYPIIKPTYPGPGLAWDLSHLWPGGNIGVIVPPVVTLTNRIARVNGTNIVVSLSWSSAQAGWVVENQSRPITLGVSLNNTNWTRISGSNTNLSETLTNTFQSGTNAVFYRLVFP